MKTGFRVSCAGLVAIVLTAMPAAAKECKDQSVSATSDAYLSRSLGAFPGSWAAWRKEVKERVGDGWQAWRRAEDRDIKCEEAAGKWTCTRTARPCKNGLSTSNPGGNGNIGTYQPIDQILRRGMEGEQVKTLQYLLREAGYDVQIDGDFGRSTEQALIKFQRDNKISVDGRAGPRTVEALTS